MSKRSKRKNNDNYKKKRTLRALIVCIAMALLCTISVSVIGFASEGFQNKDVASWVDRELNPANLIKVENYQIEDEQYDGKGIKVRVNDDGVIKLSGKATSDNSFVVCDVQLQAGEYTISGMKSNEHCTLKVVGRDNLEARAGTSSDTFVIETAQTVSVVITVSEDSVLLNKTIKPVLVKGDIAGDYYN